MVDINNLQLEVETAYDSDTSENLKATLDFDVEFSDDEQREETTYHIVGALVEVDEALDQYELDQETYPVPGGSFTLTGLDKVPEGKSDNTIGIIGETTRSAGVGSDTITFTEYLGRVATEIDGTYVITYDTMGEVDEGVVDYDEYDEEEGRSMHNAELRGMVWAVPDDEISARFSSDQEEVKFYVAGT